MKNYLILMRGVNVGGKGTISMTALKKELEKMGFTNVASYINSGNIILSSPDGASAVESRIMTMLSKKFQLDQTSNNVLAITPAQLKAIIKNKPRGFGDDPKKYYSDVIFLMGITVRQTMPIFSPKEGVDTIWPGKGVVYSQRLGSQRTKSRLNRIMSSPLYKSMTVRSWNTTTKLVALLEK